MKKRILLLLSIVLITIDIIGQPITDTSTILIDSIEAVLPTLKGKEKLQAYSKLYELYYQKDDIDTHLQLATDFLAEAENQKDVEQSDFARRCIVAVLFNYGEHNKLDQEVPILMKQFATTESWSSYFYTARQHVTSLLVRKKFDEVIHFAQDLIQFSTEHHLDDGIGLANLFIARVYTYMGRYTEAEKPYKRAIEMMSRENKDNPELAEVHLYYIDLMQRTNRYEEIGPLLLKWEELLIANNRLILPFEAYRLYLNYVDYYTATGNASKAEEYLKRTAQLPVVLNSPAGRAQYLHKSLNLRRAQGRYQEALNLVDSLYQNSLVLNDQIGTLTTYRLRAEIAAESGHYKDAYEFSERRIAVIDSVKQVEISQKLAEVHMQYEVDRHISEKTRNQNYAILLGATLLLVIAVLTIWIIYSRRLRIKNIYLVKQMRANTPEIEEQTPETKNKTKIDNSTPSSELLNNLKRLMREEMLYTNPNINRKTLADKLGTNEVYLRNAIKEEFGFTFSEYLTELRLNHAKALLELPSDQYTIEAIASDSGFGSRSTMHRQFRNRFGLSPDEYRRISNEI